MVSGLNGRGKTLRMVGFRAEIWNEDPLNIKESYPLDPLF
jgi:hypothetical protein